MQNGTYFTVAEMGPGALVAKNVTFTSASPSPAEGDWTGIFLYRKSNGTDIEGCTFEYGGNSSGAGKGVITFWDIPAKEAKAVKLENNTFKNIATGAIHSPDGDCAGFAKSNKVEGTDPMCPK
jgi:hypothetical protein